MKRATMNPAATSTPSSKSKDTQCITLYSLLISSPNGDRILAETLPESVFRLPMLRDAGELLACGGIRKWATSAVMEEYGLPVELIRIESDHRYEYLHDLSIENVMGRSDVIYPEHRVLALDVLDENAPLRGDVEWVPREVAMNGKWVQILRRVNITEWVSQVLEEGSGERYWKYNEPWNSVGWKSRTFSWVRSVLEPNGMVLVEPAIQVLNSRLSIVLRAKVEAKRTQGLLDDIESEDVFIKASVPIWREAERTMTIWRVLRDVMPEVIAMSAPNGTIIMRDAGRTPEVEELDKEGVIDVVVKMEKLSMNYIEELKAGGVRVLDEEWVARNVDWILNHDALKVDWEPEYECVTDLIKNVEDIYEACRVVASYKFPKTLVHGDVCVRNLGKRKEGEKDKYCLFDWDKAFVGNPVLEFWLIASCSKASEVRWIKEKEVMSFFQKHWLSSVAFDEMELLFRAAGVVCGVFDLFECIQLHEEYGSLHEMDMWDSKEESVEFLSSDLYEYRRKRRALRGV